jgi:hypothetical protein
MDEWREQNEDRILEQTAIEYGVSIRMVRAAVGEVHRLMEAEGFTKDEYDAALIQSAQEDPVSGKQGQVTIRGQTYHPSQMLVERIQHMKTRHVWSGGKSNDPISHFWTEEADSDAETLEGPDPAPSWRPGWGENG